MSDARDARREPPLVEIVPNFSEGRRADVIEEIVSALRVPGAVLLNRQSDPDHNRLDCTLVGDPDAVRRSAMAGAAKAIELIDMDAHVGSHPRMGAVDVIPFVPVRGMSMRECVELAREFAEELAESLRVPVYLYDRAAMTPDRASLAEVRRGQFEGLRADVERGERLPDFGPHEIGSAGAVAVGARKPLIAFNMYLSGEEGGAKEIARSVRESSGGLPAVRAIGFAVPERGLVQVSMNLVDHEATGIGAAFEAVKAEAALRGMEVVEGEIVGLVPQAALDDAARDLLALDGGFDPEEQILERLVSRARTPAIGSDAIEGFLEGVAGEHPTPGGGSAAAVAGAMGAALVAMVGRLTVGKQKYEAVAARFEELIRRADDARERFLALADRDAEAFDRVMAAMKMPRGTEEERTARSDALGTASTEAADVPLRVARLALDVLALSIEAIESGNPNAASDGAAGAQVLAASARSAIYNVEINLGSLRDPAAVERLRSEVAELTTGVTDLLAHADRAFHDRLAE